MATNDWPLHQSIMLQTHQIFLEILTNQSIIFHLIILRVLENKHFTIKMDTLEIAHFYAFFKYFITRFFTRFFTRNYAYALNAKT